MKDYSIYHYNMIIRLTIFIKASQAQGSETTPSGMEELILTLNKSRIILSFTFSAPFSLQVLPSGKLSVKVMVTIHQMKPFHSRDSEHWLYTTIFDSIDKRF